jgi:hypothetical protein
VALGASPLYCKFYAPKHAPYFIGITLGRIKPDWTIIYDVASFSREFIGLSRIN